MEIHRHDEDHFELIEDFNDAYNNDAALGFQHLILNNNIGNIRVVIYQNQNWVQNPFILNGDENLYEDRHFLADYSGEDNN